MISDWECFQLDANCILEKGDASHMGFAEKYPGSAAALLLGQLNSRVHTSIVVNDKLILIAENVFSAEMVLYREKLLRILHDGGPLSYYFAHSHAGIVIYIANNGLPFCDSSLTGIKYIYCGFDQLSIQVLIHELTHALCWSGNRFIDEGLALYMEYHYTRDIDNLPFKIVSDPESKLQIEDFRDDIVNFNEAGIYLTTDYRKMAEVYQKSFSAVECLYADVGYKKIFHLYKSIYEVKDRLLKFQKILRSIHLNEGVNRTMIDIEEAAEEILSARRHLTISKRFKVIKSAIVSSLDVVGYPEKHILVRMIATEIMINAYMKAKVDPRQVEIFDVVLSSLPSSDQASAELLHSASQVVMAKMLVSDDEEERFGLKSIYADLNERAKEVGPTYAPILIDSAIAEFFRAKEVGDSFDVCLEALSLAATDKKYEEEVSRYVNYFGLKVDLT